MSRFQPRVVVLFSIFFFLFTIAPSYSSTITTYSSQSAWSAAVNGVQTITFEGLAPAGGITTYPGGILQNGVQFVGLSGSTISVMDTTMYAWSNFGSNDAGLVSGTTPSVHIVLPACMNAFGIDLFTNPAATSVNATVLGTNFTVPTFAQPTEAFFGATSSAYIPTVDLTLQSGGTYLFFDNFQWATATQTPEAGTFLLIGSGLLSLAVIRRRARPTH